MPDAFGDWGDTIASPARSFRAVTPSDGADLADIPKALYIGVGGNVAVIGVADAAAQTFQNVPNCTILPIRARRVMATGTTAGGILGLY